MIINGNTHFTKEECNYIINLSKEQNKINPFGKSNHANKNKNFKVNYDVWVINRNDKTQWIFNKIQTYFENQTNLKKVSQLIYSLIIHYQTIDWFINQLISVNFNLFYLKNVLVRTINHFNLLDMMIFIFHHF